MNRLARTKRLRLLTTILLVTFLLTIPSVVMARIGRDVIPVRQLIELTVNADTTIYSGKVEIDLEVKIPVDSVQFNAEDMQLESVSLNGEGGEIGISYEEGKHGLITGRLSEKLAPGLYQLSIEFSNDFNTNAVGLYRVVENDLSYLFTQFEEDDAREAFPCFDQPEFKIPFTLILTVPEKHFAVANTPIESEVSNDGWRRVEFFETKPLPTYLIAIATGPLETVDIPGTSIPTRIVTVQGKSNLTDIAKEMTPPLLKALEDYFGTPYPYRKLDLIAVPEFWAGAMENAGAITFRETGLLADPATVSLRQRRGMASTLAHELAHMWFGDLVTMEWWDDLWRNEAFASWMGDKVTGEVFPEFNVPISVVRSSQGVMSGDARKSTSPIRQETQDEENLLQNIGIIYSKGQAVLQMFESWLGENAFREGVRQYLEKHEWGNATADDFWTALSESSRKDVTTPLSTFILQPGVPLVSMEPGADGELTISQKRFSNYGTEFPDAPLWQIPITLKYGIDGKVKTHSLLLTEGKTTIRLPGEAKPNWVFPDADMSGYYRWLVPPDMMKMMAEHSSEFLTPSERVGFLSNMSGLLNADLVSGGDFLSVVSRFASDSDPDVIREVVDGFSLMRRVFVNDGNRSVFADLIRQSLSPTMDRIGLMPKEGEDEATALLRPSLIGFLADEGEDRDVMEFAKEQAGAYLKDPSSVDPSLAGVVLSLSAFDGDQALYDDYRGRAENAKVPSERSRFLSTLGQFRDSVITRQALEYALSDALKPQELGIIPRGVSSQSHMMDRKVFDWMTEHYDQIVAKIPPPSRSYLAFYASGCDEELLKKGLAFFSQPEHSGPGMEHRLERVKESTEDWVSLREREEASVAEFLNSMSH